MIGAPLNTPYTGVVKSVERTERVFVAAQIQKRKYFVIFETGYRAEYCIPALQEPDFREGDTISYVITFRNDMGDTINVTSKVQGNKEPAPAQNQSGMTVGTTSMAGHPVAIALHHAMQYGIAIGNDLDTILVDADKVADWLISRKDVEAYKF